MKLISASLAILLTVLFVTPSIAAEDGTGRYQAFPIPKKEGSRSIGIFVLDTKEGHMWMYVFSAIPGKGIFEKIRYSGKVKPGQKMGDVIEENDTLFKEESEDKKQDVFDYLKRGKKD